MQKSNCLGTVTVQMKRLERRHSLFKKLCTQLIRTTNLFQVDLFSPCVAPASRSIVPYLPERRVQGRVNISDTLSSELCSEMYRNPDQIDYPTGRVAIYIYSCPLPLFWSVSSVVVLVLRFKICLLYT